MIDAPEVTATKMSGYFSRELWKDWAVLPNLVTEARIILSVLTPFILIWPGSKDLWPWAMTAFIVAALSDKVDGYLARRLNMITPLGTILDPTVDKVLSTITMVSLSVVNPLVWVPTVIIGIREYLVAALLKRARDRGQNPRVITSGKAKMVLQCVAITLLFIPATGNWQHIIWSITGGAVTLTITSGIDYLYAFREAANRKE